MTRGPLVEREGELLVIGAARLWLSGLAAGALAKHRELWEYWANYSELKRGHTKF